MSGVINFVASDFLENTTSLGTSEHTRQSSYSYPKSSFKKMFYKRYSPNRDTVMNINESSGYKATTSPIQLTIDGTTTSSAKLLRGQTLTLGGSSGSLGTIRSIYPDATLNLGGNLSTNQLILNSLSQDLPDNTDLFFSSDEALVFIQFDTEGDLVDRDQVYLIVDQEYVKIVVDTISQEISKNGYVSISPNSSTGIGRHITYIGVTDGESSLLD